jgi:hypothetical protein
MGAVAMQRINWLAFLISLGIVAPAAAQVPPPPPAPVIATPVAAPPQWNIWSFLCMTPEQKFAIRTWWCQSCLGQLSSSAMGPITGLSGGLAQNCCVLNAIELGLQQPADSAVGAAAVIKKDEAAAAARRAAVRYLGTCDCNWWPEAEEALRNALLKDRNECVRLEAALALQRGCCCNIRILKALTICVSGTGLPPENSDRVKAAAMVALASCCGVVEAVPLEQGPTPEKLDLPRKVELDDAIQNARKILAQAGSGDTSSNAGGVSMGMQRPGSVCQILTTAIGPNTGAATAPEAATVAPKVAANPASHSTERWPIFDALSAAFKGSETEHPRTQPMPASAPAMAQAPAVAVPVSVSPPPEPVPQLPTTAVAPVRAVLCPPPDATVNP